MMVSFLLGKQNFSFIIEGRTGEKQWGCPLTAVRRVLGCIPKREKGAPLTRRVVQKGCVPTGETTHYDLCVAPLLQIMFAVHRWRSGGESSAARCPLTAVC